MRVCAYRGFATSSHAFVSGRVLANRSPGELGDKQSLWRNLVDTYRRLKPMRCRMRSSPFDFKGAIKPRKPMRRVIITLSCRGRNGATISG